MCFIRISPLLGNIFLFFTFQYLTAKHFPEVDFRNVIQCKKISQMFENVKCVQETPIGKGSKSLAFHVFHQNEEMVFLLQKKNSTETMMMYQQIGSHPNIVKILKFRAIREWTYFLMEFGKFGSLSQFRRENKPKFSNATFVLQLFLKIVNGAEFINAKGFVHSDLKLGNIVIAEFYEPKIIDFELATKNGDKRGWRGTTSYMAPEVLELSVTHSKIRFNPKVDIYSLGVILYRMFIGGYPFKANSREELFDKIGGGSYLLNKGTSLDIAYILEGSLKFDPLKRFQFSHLVQKIEKALQNSTKIILWNNESISPMQNHFYAETICWSVWASDLLICAIFLIGGTRRWKDVLFKGNIYAY